MDVDPQTHTGRSLSLQNVEKIKVELLYTCINTRLPQKEEGRMVLMFEEIACIRRAAPLWGR